MTVYVIGRREAALLYASRERIPPSSVVTIQKPLDMQGRIITEDDTVLLDPEFRSPDAYHIKAAVDFARMKGQQQ